MVRTVKVNLEADAAGYIAPVEESAKATEGLDRKVEALDRDLNKVPADAAKAAAAVRLLGDESGKAGVKLDDLGKKSTSLGAIDQQIAKTRSEMRGLAEEFNRTGNTSALQMLFGRQDHLRELEKLKKDITGALDDGSSNGGKAGATSFVSSFTGFFQGKALAVAIGAAIAAAFFLANGPLLAATGLTGIAAGVVGQLHSPVVHQAFADMGHDLSAELAAATSSFQGPLVQSAGIFGEALRKAIGSIDFGALSKLLVPLASGAGGLLTNMMPGFNKALQAAQPVIQALAQELPKLGSAISDMFEKFSRGKDGAVIAIKFIIDVLRVLAEVIGSVVEAGAKMTEWLTTHLASALHAIAAAAEKLHMKGLAEGADRVATALDNLSNTDTSGLDKTGAAIYGIGAKAGVSVDQLQALQGKLSATAVTADTLAGAMTAKLFNSMMSVDQATLAVHQSLTQVSDSIKKYDNSIDESKAKGQAHVQTILGAVSANMALYQAQIAAGMSAADATTNYEANTRALHDQLRAAGLTEAQVQGLIGKYKDVPKSVNTAIAVEGLTEAINNLGNLLAKAYGLDGKSFGFTVTETLVTADRRTSLRGNRWGGIYQHAETGLLRDAKVYSSANPGRYMIAEPATGGEAFVPRFGDYARSTSILDQAARWYGGRFAPAGGGGVVVNVTVPVNAGLVADQAQLANLVGEQVVKSIKSGGAVRYAISAVAAGQGF